MGNIELKAKDFSSRQELEAKVRSISGLKPELNGNKIVGKREELKPLQLSDRSVFWGYVCEITDTPTKSKKVNKVPRGKVHPSGINKKVKKLKKVK